jgi:hypothetical protein
LTVRGEKVVDEDEGRTIVAGVGVVKLVVVILHPEGYEGMNSPREIVSAMNAADEPGDHCHP